jgi:hypothetical protein
MHTRQLLLSCARRRRASERCGDGAGSARRTRRQMSPHLIQKVVAVIIIGAAATSARPRAAARQSRASGRSRRCRCHARKWLHLDRLHNRILTAAEAHALPQAPRHQADRTRTHTHSHTRSTARGDHTRTTTKPTRKQVRNAFRGIDAVWRASVCELEALRCRRAGWSASCRAA